MKYIVNVDGHSFELSLTKDAGKFIISYENQSFQADLVKAGTDGHYSLILDQPSSSDNGNSYDLHCQNLVEDGLWEINLNGRTYQVSLEDERTRKLKSVIKTGADKSSQEIIKATMPGLVIAVEVQEGEQVKAGQGLLIIEAMKMENEIRATQPGTIKSIHVKTGQIVNIKDTLISIV